MIGEFENRNKKVSTWLAARLLLPENDDCTEIEVSMSVRDFFRLHKNLINRVVIRNGHLVCELKSNPF